MVVPDTGVSLLAKRGIRRKQFHAGGQVHSWCPVHGSKLESIVTALQVSVSSRPESASKYFVVGKRFAGFVFIRI